MYCPSEVSRRLSGHLNGPKHYLPTENTALTLPFLLTAPTLPLLFTLEESTLRLFLTRSVSTVVGVETLLRLYRLLRTLLDFLSIGGMAFTRSLGTDAEAGDKSDWEGSESGNSDVLGAGDSVTDIVLLDS